MKRILSYFSVLMLALASFATLASAQSIVTGDISGTVSDPSGAVVPNAQINLKSDETGETRSTTTNNSGLFRFSLLRPGNYTVTTSAQGFKEATTKTVVNLGQVTSLVIQAGVEQNVQTVEVTAEAPLLQTDNANLSTTYNETQIANLPAPGGDTTSYAYTTPGITISTGAGYGGFSAYGLPSNSNLFTVNGNDNMDPYLNLNNSGASNLTLGANELQEVGVVENGYSVQYGRNAGAQVNTTTKSGTNTFHGNLSYWFNSTAFNANDWFTNQSGTGRPHAVNHEWADSIGGPIFKNKLFFFADSEGLRYVLPGGGAPVYLPTQAFQNFVLGNLAATNPTAVPFYQKQFALYNGANGASRATPAGPASCGLFAAGGFGGDAGASCSNQFISTVNNLNTEWLMSVRVDYNISDKDRLYGRFRTDHGVQATGTDPINSVFNANSVQPESEGQLTENHIFGSTASNQIIISGTYYRAIFGPPNLSAALAAFPTTTTFNDGLLSSLGGTDNAYPQGRNVSQYQIVDDFSKTFGNHEMKFGGNFRRNNITSFASGPGTSGLLTFNDINDFVNGNIGTNSSTYSQTFVTTGPAPIAVYSLALYAQDQWKPTSKLSLTYGLRVDRNADPTCRSNCFNELLSPLAQSNLDPTAPYNSVIHTGVSQAFPHIEKLAWQPRVGVVYSLRPNTIIRSGIGLFSDLYPAFLADRFLTNAPAVASFTDQSGGTVTPGDPNSVFANVANSNAAFRNSFANGGTLQSIQAILPSFAPPSFNTLANTISNPKYLEYNLEVEQGIGQRATASINYVGNYGYDEFNQNRLANAFCKTANCPFSSALPVGAAPSQIFGSVDELNNHGYSNYNGVTTTLRFRAAGYLQGSLSYTYAHALDTCSNNCLLPFNTATNASIRNQIDPASLNLNYGSADYDVRHSVNGNYVLTAPKRVGNAFTSLFLGGWTMAETLYYKTGYPFSATNSSLRSTYTLNGGASVFLADFLGGSAPGSCQSPTTACLTASEFATPGTQTDFGNVHRNNFRAAPYFDTDVNLTKNIRLTERFNLGFGANLFNILNHPNFDAPVGAVNSGAFGNIQQTVSPPTSPYGSFTGSAVSGRIIQVNAHLNF